MSFSAIMATILVVVIVIAFLKLLVECIYLVNSKMNDESFGDYPSMSPDLNGQWNDPIAGLVNQNSQGQFASPIGAVN